MSTRGCCSVALTDRVLADYKRAMARVGEDIAVRRFSGPASARTYVDTTVRARVVGYEPHELVGAIKQGDRKVVALVDALSAVLPVTTADALVVRGKPLAIEAVDDSTRRVDGVLIALEIQVRGG